jgi:hypothetical protein
MKILFDILIVLCDLWMLIIILGILWFAWLHHKGELIADVPDSVKDIF